MSAEPIPPRPDGMHPMPAPPPVLGRSAIADRPRATWRAWEAVAVYLVAVLVGGLATLPIFAVIHDEDAANLVASAAAAIVILGVLVGWLSTSHPTWREVLGLPERGRWLSEIRASVGFGLLLYPAMVFGVGIVVSVVLSAIFGEPAQAPEQVPSGLPVAAVVVAILYAIVIAPIHEELYFRGILFRAVGDRYGLVAGLLATGLGFSLIHYVPGPWEDALLLMGVMFFNGMALAWWYARRGTIVASIVAHMVFNVIGMTLILTIG